MNHTFFRFVFMLALFSLPGQSWASLNVFACHNEWAVLAKAIGGDSVSVYVPKTVAPDSRQVKVSSSLTAVLRSSDVVICSVGYRWISKAIKKASNEKLAKGAAGSILINDLVKLDKVVDIHADDPHENPFVHGDPRRLRAIAGQVASRFIQLDKSAADLYRKNAKEFIQDLGSLIQEGKAIAQSLSGETMLVDPFSYYFFEWLGVAAITNPKLADKTTTSFVASSGMEKSYHDELQKLAKDKGLQFVRVPFGPVLDGQPGTYEEYFQEAIAIVLENSGKG